MYVDIFLFDSLEFLLRVQEHNTHKRQQKKRQHVKRFELLGERGVEALRNYFMKMQEKKIKITFIM